MERLIAAQSGASRVFVFDHTLRTGDEAERQAKKIREPVKSVHNDYTEWSGPQRVRDFFPEEAGSAPEAALCHHPGVACDRRAHPARSPGNRRRAKPGADRTSSPPSGGFPTGSERFTSSSTIRHIAGTPSR
jgi:hypothetical protein